MSTSTPPPVDPPAGSPPPGDPPAGSPPPPPADPPPGDPPAPSRDDVVRDPQALIDLVGTLRDENRRHKRREADRERADRAAADAAKTELERANERAAAAEDNLHTERRERLATQVAAAKGLPMTLAARLRGDTVEELERDADEVLKALGRAAPRAPVDYGSGSRLGDGQPAGGTDAFSAQLRRAAGRS